jgi:hypothetical protein
MENTMIRSHRMWGTALVLATAQAAAMAAVNPEVAQDLTKKSGLWTQLDSLGTQVRAGMAAAMAKNPGTVTEAQKTRMLDCAQSAYASDGLRSPAIDAVAGTLQPADVAPLQAWYDGPLGRKISAMEASSGTQVTDPQERLRRGGEALSGASEARKASLQAILTETHSVDIMADTLIEMALAVQQGMASFDPAASGTSIAELKANLSSRRPQLIQHYAQIALPAYAFTYAELGDEELKTYADYLGTPAAMSFNDGSTRGVARALTSGSVKLGRCLKDAGVGKSSS